MTIIKHSIYSFPPNTIYFLSILFIPFFFLFFRDEWVTLREKKQDRLNDWLLSAFTFSHISIFYSLLYPLFFYLLPSLPFSHSFIPPFSHLIPLLFRERESIKVIRKHSEQSVSLCTRRNRRQLLQILPIISQRSGTHALTTALQITSHLNTIKTSCESSENSPIPSSG